MLGFEPQGAEMAQSSWYMTLGGSDCVATCDVLTAAYSDAETLPFLVTFFEDTLQPYLSDELVLQEIRLGDAVLSVGLAGAVSEPAAPANCALIIQKNTGTSVRGRWFWPGILEQDVDPGGRVGTELRALIDAAITPAVLALRTEELISLDVVSEKTDPAIRYPITSMTARPLIGTLRNRLVGR